jgi:uncharacterized protein (DUF2062 family)
MTGVDAGMPKTLSAQLSDAMASLPLFTEWALGIGLPLLLGLAVFAAASSVLGYVAVNGLWQLSVRRRWSRRRARRT